MKINPLRLLIAAILAAPSSLYALGLGEIHLNSALNQPFDADIELVSPSPDELSSLKVGLASSDTFSKYGIDRPQFLSNFAFRVARTSDGHDVLKVTSNASVTEPYVTFLIEASWPRGRVVREYTVLLDPPVFVPGETAATQAPVAAPRSGARSEGVVDRSPGADSTSAPASDSTSAVQAPSSSWSSGSSGAGVAGSAAGSVPHSRSSGVSQSAPSIEEGGQYTVRRNDSLWKIAADIRPGSPSVIIEPCWHCFAPIPRPSKATSIGCAPVQYCASLKQHDRQRLGQGSVRGNCPSERRLAERRPRPEDVSGWCLRRPRPPMREHPRRLGPLRSSVAGPHPGFGKRANRNEAAARDEEYGAGSTAAAAAPVGSGSPRAHTLPSASRRPAEHPLAARRRGAGARPGAKSGPAARCHGNSGATGRSAHTCS